MSFQNQFAVASCKNQLIPQQLTNNVFFGPLNALSQASFLQANNIKFFVAVGIPTARVAQYCQSFPANQFLMVNYDPLFNPNVTNSPIEQELVSQYVQTQSASLKLLTTQLGAQTETNYNSARGLTPQPELEQLLYKNASSYDCNLITAQTTDLFDTFNDLLTIFRLSNAGNVLVFSSSGNENELASLLISHILNTNPQTTVLEALQYLRSLRPTIAPNGLDQAFCGTNLALFAEKLRTKHFSQDNCNVSVADSSLSSHATSLATKRRNLPSSDEEDDGFDDENESMNMSFSSLQSLRAASGTPKARKISARPPGS
ncbi:LAFA_0C09516g1_1 [Lachancea sp. 'fantastica']|nr:LAFA_0C09516g1_1 [Lachancea sp. 'fantastica']